MASRSVMRLIPSRPASSRSAGKWSPGATTPSLITVSRRSTVSSKALPARTGPRRELSSVPVVIQAGLPVIQAHGLDMTGTLTVNGLTINHWPRLPARLRGHLPAGLGPQLVHWAEGPGHAGAARRDRARARGLTKGHEPSAPSRRGW